MHIDIYICIYIYTCVCVYACVYIIYIYMCVCMCMYIYICTYNQLTLYTSVCLKGVAPNPLVKMSLGAISHFRR